MGIRRARRSRASVRPVADRRRRRLFRERDRGCGGSVGGVARPVESMGVRQRAPSSRIPIAGLAVSLGVYILYSWSPFDFQLSGEVIRPRIPMIVRGSLLRLLSEPRDQSGRRAARQVRDGRANRHVPRLVDQRHLRSLPPDRVAAASVLTAMFFAVVEAGQLLLPTRYPDNTDILLGLAGVLAGSWMVRRFGASSPLLRRPDRSLGHWMPQESTRVRLRHRRRAAAVRPSTRYSNWRRNSGSDRLDGRRQLRQLVRILEVVAPQPDHVAARDGVARRADVDQAHARPAGLAVDHLANGNRHEVAALHRDHRGVAAGEQVLRGAVAEVARVLHVERNRIGAAQLVADVLRGDRRLDAERAAAAPSPAP